MPRYIDADELVHMLTTDFDTLYETIFDTIRRVPTIDAKPVVHSHWANISISVSGHSSAECFVCGCVVHDSFSNKINYCPHCGAMMQKGDSNDKL